MQIQIGLVVYNIVRQILQIEGACTRRGPHRKQACYARKNAKGNGNANLEDQIWLEENSLVGEHHLCISHGDLIKALDLNISPHQDLANIPTTRLGSACYCS